MTRSIPPVRWDIFCAVIDNYGDIGVCWRLARQLVREWGVQVRLWVDDLVCLQALHPETDPAAETQRLAGVEVRHWHTPFPEVQTADVVIEAFGCPLPQSYLAAMAGLQRKPVWINLEYLSAESWVEGCHGLSSPHPQLPLTKHFFFPGFTPATGGLLREQGLLQTRDRERAQVGALWQTLGLPSPATGAVTVSLFCYDSAPLEALLAAWRHAAHPVHVLLPVSKALPRAAACLGRDTLEPGTLLQQGNLTLQVIPFLRQEDYDRLLWACDCNFVRGEDSFLRAQWAGRPLVWQIYRQQEDAHRPKLEAFLDLYCAALEPAAATAVRAIHTAWNDGAPLDWDAWRQHAPTLQAHAMTWSARLAEAPDLAANLVIFCGNRV